MNNTTKKVYNATNESLPGNALSDYTLIGNNGTYIATNGFTVNLYSSGRWSYWMPAAQVTTIGMPNPGAVAFDDLMSRGTLVTALTLTTGNALSELVPGLLGTGAGGGEGLNGEFSISNWEGYPNAGGGLRPEGPFRMLEGQEYQDARDLANVTNRLLRNSDPDAFQGLEIHEIQPVKFGGSPTDMSNKILLTPQEHRLYNAFWNTMMRGIK
jgi:hypothetical protein